MIKRGAPTLVSRRTEKRYGAKLCEFFKQYLVEEGRGLIKDAAERGATCMSQFYSCDCTPMKTAQRLERGTVVRVGKFSAMELGMGTLREEGFGGIASTLYVQDRGKNADKALRRFWMRRHKYQYTNPSRLPFSSVENLDELEMKDWPMSLGCALHDMQNGGEKSVLCISGKGGDTVVDDAYALTKSLAGGYSFMFLAFEEWVFSRLRYKDRSSADAAAAGAFFCLCNLRDDVLAAFEVLQFYADAEGLYIATQFEGNDAAYELLLEALMQSFGFVVFTLSRWLSVLRSANRLMFAWYIGLDDLVDYVTEKVHGSSFHLSGYRKHRSTRVRFFVVAAGLSMQPCEVMQAQLLSDDRMYLLYQEYSECFANARRKILHLSDGVWTILMGLLHDEKDELTPQLRSDVLGGVVIGTAYTRRVCFHQFEEYPHRLAVNWGDESRERGEYVHENVSEMLLLDDADVAELDETSRKIYWSVKSGLLSVSDVVEAVLQWHAWSVTAELVEQGHGAFAAVRKAHTGFSAEHVQQQGFRRTFSSTRPKKDRRLRSIELLKGLIEKVQAKQPQKTRAVHVLKDDLEAEHAQLHRRNPTPEERTAIKKRATDQIKTMGANQLRGLRDRLEEVARKKQVDSAEVISQAQYFVLKYENEIHAAENARAAPGFIARMKLSDCSYTVEQVEAYAQKRWGELSHAQVEALREAARQPPNTTEAWKAQQLDVKEPVLRRVMPGWVRRVVAQKEKRILQLTRFTTADGRAFYGVLAQYLRRAEEWEILDLGGNAAGNVVRVDKAAAPVAKTRDVIFDEQYPTLAGVLQSGEGVRMKKQREVYTVAEFVDAPPEIDAANDSDDCVSEPGMDREEKRQRKPLPPNFFDYDEEDDLRDEADQVNDHPEPKRSKAEAAATSSDVAENAHPAGGAGGGSSSGASSSSSSAGASSSGSASASSSSASAAPRKQARAEVADEEVEKQKKIMEEAKNDLRRSLAENMAYKVVPRGAKSNMLKRSDGLFCDCYRVDAINSDAGKFLTRMKQPKGKQYSVSKFTTSGAALLCLHFARRMSMLHNLYCTYGRSTPAQSQSLDAAAALQQLEETTPAVKRARQQIDTIVFTVSHLDGEEVFGGDGAAEGGEKDGVED
eukprot:g19727.t1